MTKLKLFGAASLIAVGVVAIGSFAFAQSATLAVSCSGALSGTNQIVWSAVATGGNAPHSFVWFGDSSIASSTASTTTGTYVTSTVSTSYTADILVTDASSTMATSSCSQTIAGIVAPVATTSTLNVVLSVNNSSGGSASPSNFTVSVNGASATPSSFGGSATGTSVIVAGGTNYTVSASSLANYAATQSGNCTGPITAGGADACTVTETYTPPTTTPPAPRVNPPTLSIGQNGAFLGRGMTVTSIGTNSFQASVWGITYTVNWSGNLYAGTPFEFYFRYLKAGTTSTPATQLQVGDEVGVAGTVSSSSPLVVTASVVRDYSTAAARTPVLHGEGNGKGNNGNGLGNGGPNGDDNGNGSSTGDLNNRLNQLLQQFQSLQGLLNNGHGNGK